MRNSSVNPSLVCTSFYPVDNLQNTFRLSDDSNTCCFQKSILISLTFMTWNVDSMAKKGWPPPGIGAKTIWKNNRGALLSAPRLFENVCENGICCYLSSISGRGVFVDKAHFTAHLVTNHHFVSFIMKKMSFWQPTILCVLHKTYKNQTDYWLYGIHYSPTLERETEWRASQRTIHTLHRKNEVFILFW